MQKFVVNLRPSQQIAPSIGRVHRNSRELAHQATGTAVLLYAPRDESTHGYFATAHLVEVLADPSSANHLLLVFDRIELFDVPVSPDAVSTLGNADNKEPEPDPFYTYARGIRPIAQCQFDQIVELAAERSIGGMGEPPSKANLAPPEQERQRGTRETYIRSQRLRVDALDHYGPICAATRLRLGPLTWWRHEVDICHIVPVSFGGEDKVSNVMPLLRSVHWAFDNGLFMVRPSREIVFRADAPADLVWMFRGNRQAYFPTSPLAWPKTEHLEFHFSEIFSKVGL
ncbi:hypothetical protein VW29_00140 [Devosia limi DSM 17137]|uniref:HNH endonuclease n=1 Tax=Devosia limi DSM 17137 TaxID=1121477 RepID=A0A0F5LWU0_9HYPH|nr:HNH endonuclease signature motif containing protein [Devosia limi]KKB86840.1 hypothetical protein VW29_00140 [Devosia limi DSM 17137]SHG01798.1 HNH endonuclease [Devosia limi DSM 17137]